ncbi:hypothetical protein CJJ23_01660 [Mycoplasmopsis agassizii]|uniref:Uncharacterized protein n=1 Tax=Mycoplasmopsis agassizii TaxID=33922 RepID=A0A269TJZ6_9BACT|nr:hypothetical protein [Mycoplasmopsis agassizii]PAK21480.1 hypothetical protein CJJ23_01660 [Mycoplasmopsis agassizii]
MKKSIIKGAISTISLISLVAAGATSFLSASQFQPSITLKEKPYIIQNETLKEKPYVIQNYIQENPLLNEPKKEIISFASKYLESFIYGTYDTEKPGYNRAHPGVPLEPIEEIQLPKLFESRAYIDNLTPHEKEIFFDVLNDAIKELIDAGDIYDKEKTSEIFTKYGKMLPSLNKKAFQIYITDVKTKHFQKIHDEELRKRKLELKKLEEKAKADLAESQRKLRESQIVESQNNSVSTSSIESKIREKDYMLKIADQLSIAKNVFIGASAVAVAGIAFYGLLVAPTLGFAAIPLGIVTAAAGLFSVAAATLSTAENGIRNNYQQAISNLRLGYDMITDGFSFAHSIATILTGILTATSAISVAAAPFVAGVSLIIPTVSFALSFVNNWRNI